MAIINKQFLQDIGVQLADIEYEALAEHFDTTLEERVVNELADILTADQARQLAALDGASQEDYQRWLTQNVPDFSEIVSDEIDILLGEIAENSDALSGDTNPVE